MEVIGYENYLIYEDGRVQNKKTKRYLKPTKVSGYDRVMLSGPINKSFLCHRLVAIHYILNPDNKPCVDHINRNRSDNRLENLRWATFSENGQNSEMYKTNKSSGIKNIYPKEIGFQYMKRIKNKTHTKRFKTLEDAIQYKKQYENALD